MKRLRLFSLLVVIALIGTACSATPTQVQTSAPVVEATTEAPAAAPTEAPTMAPTEVMTATTVVTTTAPTAAITPTTTTEISPTASVSVTPTVGVVATIPDASLVQKGKLSICTDFPYPPQEYFDENGNPQGLDIEIGNELAARLGLKPQYINSVFDTIIAAAAGGKCDIIISAQNITTDRNKKVSMIPYFQAGQSFVVAKGNPQNINGPTDLCGKSVAAESGTTEAFYLEGTGDFAGKGLTQDCTKAGKEKITLVVTQKDTDALQQLQSGKVAAYFADSPVAAYYTVQHPDQFQLAGQIIQPALEGISVPCGEADCTSAPLTPVGKGILDALKSMISDGTYAKILAKWNLTDGAIDPTLLDKFK